MDTTPAGQATASGTTITHPPITTVSDGAMLIAGANFFKSATGPITHASGWTEGNDGAANTPNNSNWVVGNSAYNIRASAGPTGSETSTGSGWGSSVGLLADLRPE